MTTAALVGGNDILVTDILVVMPASQPLMIDIKTWQTIKVFWEGRNAVQPEYMMDGLRAWP